MAVTQLGLNINLSWLMAVANVYGTNTTEGPDNINFSLSGVDVTTYNQLYACTYTIAASGSQTIDLTSLTNLVSESFGFGHVLAMVIKTSGSPITLSPGASNGFVYNFGGTSPTWTVANGGVFAVSESTTGGVAVTSSYKTITLTNNGRARLRYQS